MAFEMCNNDETRRFYKKQRLNKDKKKCVSQREYNRRTLKTISRIITKNQKKDFKYE